jgi:predicted nucleic acid-binding protein
MNIMNNNRLEMLPTDIQDIIYKRNSDYNFMSYMFLKLYIHSKIEKYEQAYMNPHSTEKTTNLRKNMGQELYDKLKGRLYVGYIDIFDLVDNNLQNKVRRYYNELSKLSYTTYSQIYKNKSHIINNLDK